MISQPAKYLTRNPAFAVDCHGTITLWNRAAERKLGYSATAALGRRCWRLLCGQDAYGNHFCHRHCSLRKMAFERKRVNGCHLRIRTAVDGLQQFAIDSRLVSDAAGRDLLLHTCLPEGALQKHGEQLDAGFSGNVTQSFVLQDEPGVATHQAANRHGILPENPYLKLDFTDLLKIGDLLEKFFHQKLCEAAQLDGNDTGFMYRLELVVEQNHADPQFGLPELASEMYMCARQLQRKVKDATGYNPAEFLRCYRLKKARELLRTGRQVGLVADAVGFSSPAYFTSCFKTQFGQTPSDYQQQFQ